MNRLLPTAAVLAAFPLICAFGGGGSCATASEPRIETVTVKVMVPVPCADQRNDPPAFIDRLDDIKAAVARGEIDVAFGLAMGGREQRIQWQEESDAQIAACARPPNPG